MIAWFEAHPTLALGGIIILVLLGGGYLLKGKAATPASAPAQDLSGLSNGIVYVPTATTFSTTNQSGVVTNSGSGTVSTGPINGQPAHQPINGSPNPPVRSGPVSAPKRVSVQWNQHVTASNQSLNLLAHNASVSINRDYLSAGMGAPQIIITGQQIYNHNISIVNTAWSRAKGKGSVSMDNNSFLTGVSLILPHVVLI